MIQTKQELDDFHSGPDPWGYETNMEDHRRREILVTEIPKNEYENVLEIGCGQGFITQSLPGKNILATDISAKAIELAKLHNKKHHITFQQLSIFETDKLSGFTFDLIIISGVLYKQYIGQSSSLIYLQIDQLLQKGGSLVVVHIADWYYCRFPYVLVKQLYYPYREYIHHLEVYRK